MKIEDMILPVGIVAAVAYFLYQGGNMIGGALGDFFKPLATLTGDTALVSRDDINRVTNVLNETLQAQIQDVQQESAFRHSQTEYLRSIAPANLEQFYAYVYTYADQMRYEVARRHEDWAPYTDSAGVYYPTAEAWGLHVFEEKVRALGATLGFTNLIFNGYDVGVVT